MEDKTEGAKNGGPYRTPGTPNVKLAPQTRAEQFEERLREAYSGQPYLLGADVTVLAKFLGWGLAELADAVDEGSRRIEAAMDRLRLDGERKGI